MAPVELTEELVERFVLWLDEDENGCWLWTRGCKPEGYGQVWVDGYNRRAHRVAWELWRGPIPAGLELDHLCRVPRCCNPAHLEPVTGRENVLRGETIVAACLAKTHCPAGHPYDEANTYVVPSSGHRQCRTCRHDHGANRQR